MESLYYVISYACHRKCVHCYDTRFRPYVRDALEEVVLEGEKSHAKIIENLPDRMTYLDLKSPLEGGGYEEKVGRIVLSGGEVLVNPVRERILYPVLEKLQAKYKNNGGINIIVQTTGDLVTEEILDDLLARGIWMISISGMDDYHVGMQDEKREELMGKLTGMFEARGMKPSGHAAPVHDWSEEAGPVYHFFGAEEDAWIGKLWPRGRAWENGLSKATIDDNFCAEWSGAKNFLNYGYSGSEVSIEPGGDFFPCCLKTKAPFGNLTEEKLTDILDDLKEDPAIQALNDGNPFEMGVSRGWDKAKFIDASKTITPKGEPYANPCIGCDAFHNQVLAPVLNERRANRLGHN
jgi:sulfatase maturation enzyme AslB (radical SAM superfamily)